MIKFGIRAFGEDELPNCEVCGGTNYYASKVHIVEGYTSYLVKYAVIDGKTRYYCKDHWNSYTIPDTQVLQMMVSLVCHYNKCQVFKEYGRALEYARKHGFVVAINKYSRWYYRLKEKAMKK